VHQTNQTLGTKWQKLYMVELNPHEGLSDLEKLAFANLLVWHDEIIVTNREQKVVGESLDCATSTGKSFASICLLEALYKCVRFISLFICIVCEITLPRHSIHLVVHMASTLNVDLITCSSM